MSVCCDTVQALMPVCQCVVAAQALVFLLVSVCCDTAQAQVSVCCDTAQALMSVCQCVVTQPKP